MRTLVTLLSVSLILACRPPSGAEDEGSPAPTHETDPPEQETDAPIDTEPPVDETDPPVDTDETDPPVDTDETDPPADADADADGVPASIDCDDDDDTVGAPVDWFLDRDGDGFGDRDVPPVERCEAPSAEHVALGGDCDDGRVTVNPDAVERCSTAYDDDCDGLVNDASAVDAVAWWLDADLDGYGGGEPVMACTEPSAAHVARGGDCDDTLDSVNPGSPEDCDTPYDDDCDGDVNDSDALGASSWWPDEDEDGWGRGVAVHACVAPAGHVGRSGDCDDALPTVNPDAQETCATPYDDDCDGKINDDDAVDRSAWYLDDDRDGYGTGDPVLSCAPIPGHADNDDDCDDTRWGVNPGAEESCATPYDDDCDGRTDDAIEIANWYLDADGDGFGDGGGAPTQSCDAPSPDHVPNNDDCDDTDPDVRPDADERCDTPYDDDCDGHLDEPDAIGAIAWRVDADDDGFGAGLEVYACEAPTSAHVVDDGDCDDGDPLVHPDADERCDTPYDDDCDGDVNEDDATDATPWWYDGDRDGWGGDDHPPRNACLAPTSAYVARDGDCADDDAQIHPEADERCDTPWDDDCDGYVNEDDATDAVLWYVDADLDGFGGENSTYACEAPDLTYAEITGDCDDGDALVHPEAPERCDTPYDDDCDGEINEDDAEDALDWYVDADGDEFGTGAPVTACTPPGDGWVEVDGDCDDQDDARNPGAPELCATPYDDDCDGDDNDGGAVGATKFYADQDGDGFGHTAGGVREVCYAPSGYVDNSDDCDDKHPARNPAQPELCVTPFDDDCDPSNDNAGVDATTWWYDGDGDGWGGESSKVFCEPAKGYVHQTGDCDDLEPRANPDATEDCATPFDDDCDGDTEDPEAIGAKLWYADGDGDGIGAGTGALACTGISDRGDDCDDADPYVYPKAPELCDGRANGCESSWKPAHEDKQVAYEDAGVWSDITADFTGAYALPASGTIHVCAGNYDVRLTATNTGGSAKVQVVGIRGASETTLDAGGAGPTVSAVDSSVTLEGLTLTGGQGAKGGGAYLQQASLTMLDCVVTGNSATEGGGIYVDPLSSLTLEGTQVIGNTATSRGGGVHLQQGKIRTYSGTRFDDNEAASGGGLSADDPTQIYFNDTTFEGNQATDGGALWLSSATTNFHDVVVRGNVATGAGGGIYASHGWLLSDTLRVEDNVAARGGGMLLLNTSTDERLAGLTLLGNESTDDGGGALLSFGSGSIVGATIRDNVAGRRGGGLYVIGVGVSLEDVALEQNQARSAGGGLAALNSVVTLTDSTVRDNEVSGTTTGVTYLGAGVYAEGTVIRLEGTTVADNTFAIASFTKHGGGVYLTGMGATLTLADAVVSGHDAWLGGGVHLDDRADLKIEAGGIIRGNTAAHGGGVFVGEASAVTCTGLSTGVTGIRNNHAQQRGGGVFLTGSSNVTRFEGTLCDMGQTGSPADNTAQIPATGARDVDAAGKIYGIGDNATFTCDALNGC